jgi:tellurite resistance protein TehA-like permease
MSKGYCNLLIMGLSSTIRNEIKGFYPGYFALVMATGIISTASQQLHYTSIARLLFILNNVQYFILLLIIIIRLLLFLPQVKADLSAHAKGAGFLTFVAASCILGTGYVQGKQLFDPGIWLIVPALIAWLILVYSFLLLVILKKEKPSPETGLNGSWLLLVVATQSLTILGTSLAPHLSFPINNILFITFCGWLLGIVLYVVLLTLILYRLIYYPINASEVSPSYWIDTGAAAICALAGATLIKAFAGTTDYAVYIPAMKMAILLLWATATFWLPLLFILETWRHYKAGFSYSPAYWSMVFPLGMYTVATLQLAAVIQLHFLNAIAGAFIFIAWAAWVIVFIGMIVNLLKVFLPRKQV